MPSVCFVCLGNICRSPMADAVFRHLITKRHDANQWHVDSAGTGAYHVGDAPDPRTVNILEANGVPAVGRARQVQKGDFSAFDWLLAMDEQNIRDLKSRAPKEATATIQLLGDFDPQGERIIGDPYYGGAEGFRKNFDQVMRSCHGFLDAFDA